MNSEDKSVSPGVGWFTVTNSAALISLLTLFVYLVGWQYARAYFSTLGAPWMLDAMGPQEFLWAGRSVLGLFLTGALGASYLLIQGRVQLKTLNRIQLGLVYIAVVSGLTNAVPARWIPVGWQERLLVVGLCVCVCVCVFAVAMGMAAVDWMWRFQGEGGLPRSVHMQGGHWILYVACWLLPSAAGSAAASWDLDAKN
jgi:hypothetical protein